MLPQKHLDDNTSLRTLESSLSGTRLRLGLKRLGFEPRFAKLPATFGQLSDNLRNGGSVTVATARGEEDVPTGSGVYTDERIGHDVQDVRSLPDAADFWRHEFYFGSFHRTEIAYAVVLGNPKEHFAGFWAAKEALKKCDPSFIRLDIKQIAVAHRSNGSPFFVFESLGKGVSLFHSVSISHSGDIASAVVLMPRRSSA